MRKKINCIIIDDEQKSCDVLRKILDNYCPSVNVCGIALNADDGVALVNRFKPDLVFLDIEMRSGDGFYFLSRFSPPSFSTIFITAFDQYAIKAIRHAAFDYLLKPLSIGQVRSAVERFSTLTQENEEEGERPGPGKKAADNGFHKIAIPTLTGFELVDIEDILWLMASDSYTVLYLREKQQVISSNYLGKYEDLLCGIHPFVRIHNSYIINLNHVAKIVKGKHLSVVMKDGKSLDVSLRKRDSFLELFK